MIDWFIERKLERLGRRANPDRTFVSALERRMTAELRPQRSRLTGWKLAAGSFTSLSLLLGGTGVYAYASDTVLPDHPLYAARGAIEQTEDRLTFTDGQRANIRLKHLRRRLKEQELMNRGQKPVTHEQMENFVSNVEAAIDVAGRLPEAEREKLDRVTERVEREYAAGLIKARERVRNESEKEKIDRILEEQTRRLDERVERLNEKRRAAYERLMERRKKIMEFQRLRIQDLENSRDE